MRQKLARLLKDNKGTTAIEYALIAGLIALAIVTATAFVGSNVLTLMNVVASKFP